MNILAHLYLSKGINPLMLGNFIGDFVKGNKYNSYPDEIRSGIILHREIDTYTDNHPLHLKSRDRLRPKYGLYSGVVVDIIFDHFLAVNWHLFHATSLSLYADQVYAFLQNNFEIMPSKLREITPAIISNNWLLMYSTKDGIERVLNGMANRTSLPNEGKFAMEILNDQFSVMESEFLNFFGDMEKNIYI